MQGKYSPTVSTAYWQNQTWFESLGTDEVGLYDLDGYDSYGYNAEGYDRAGHQEHEYYSGDLYEQVLEDWEFDGTRPVLRADSKAANELRKQAQLKALQADIQKSLELLAKLKANAEMLMGKKPIPKGLPKSTLLQGLCMGMEQILNGPLAKHLQKEKAAHHDQP